MHQPKLRVTVYNPCYQTIDVARDWDITETTTDVIQALAQPYRIAAMRVFYDQPWIHSYDPTLASTDLSQFDLVLFSDVEYYTQADIEAWIATKNVKQYVLALGGINTGDSLKDNQVYRPYWIRHFVDQNTYVNTEDSSKPYMFDALLGARRPHRDYVMLALTQTKLLDQSIVTYRDCFPGAVINQQNDYVQSLFPRAKLNWPYVSPHLDPAWEVSQQVNNQISFISPVEIYRRTQYSIICETAGTGSAFFLSEKTIKAMFNRRIFVMFGPAGYLERLRSMGFETFRGIVDESYDEEPRDTIRFQKAMQQVMRLAWFEQPVDMYSSMQEVLDQNQRRLFELEEKRQRELRELLHRYIPNQYWLW